MIGTEALDVDRIRQDLIARTVGSQIHLFQEVPSTNLVLQRLARAGAPEGTVVLAEAQTAGRGRLGKPWFSPAGMNLYASVLFRPLLRLAEAAVFSFIAPLALADAVQEEGVEPAIKWPNDILPGKRKVAGILAESWAPDDRVEYVLLGAAVNLNVDSETLRSELGPASQSAASLREAAGREIDRNTFTARFLTLLDEWSQIYRSSGARTVLQSWRDRDITSGRRVEVREGSERFDGRAIGMNAEGHLVVQDFSGRVRRVGEGEFVSSSEDEKEGLMTAPWILLAALAAVGLVYVLLPVGLEVFFRFRAARRLRCPETGADAEVGVDAGRAAFTALLGRPHLRIERCSLWPERMGCGQACLNHFEEKPPEALHTESS